MNKSAITLAAAFWAASNALAMAQGIPGQHFMENWDLNEDGTVTLAEITERRDNVFISFDADDNGSLSAEEYELFDEARASHQNDGAQGQGGGKGHGKGAGEMMDMVVNDTNADGVVSRDEFMAQAPLMLAALDKNSDGTVTAADFKKR
ncbi:EF-hand domain-containing protein [Litoreibacter janthinus]|uniref:EF hand n=1 Tax=Litoreibacter janthinus TaxID=670154 RepID=A0A1I6FRB2_9RHOB|nr:EF-hand domain-containing protein [Litoreibacter janthinus]SFR32337.1 EF hand [Litoreibacter janthinus]